MSAQAQLARDGVGQGVEVDAAVAASVGVGCLGLVLVFLDGEDVREVVGGDEVVQRSGVGGVGGGEGEGCYVDG